MLINFDSLLFFFFSFSFSENYFNSFGQMFAPFRRRDEELRGAQYVKCTSSQLTIFGSDIYGNRKCRDDDNLRGKTKIKEDKRSIERTSERANEEIFKMGNNDIWKCSAHRKIIIIIN